MSTHAVSDVDTYKAWLESLYAELHEPAGAVLDQARALRAGADGADLAEFLDDIDRIVDAGHRLSQHVEDLGAASAGSDASLDWRAIRHDLRSKINAIKGYGEMLVEDVSGDEAPDVRTGLEKLLDLTEGVLGRLDGINDPPPSAAEAEASKTAAEAVAEGAAPATDGRVLVVDDTEENRLLLVRWLRRENYHVEAADGGQRALAMLRESPFDIVLLDLMMPEMDGFEVLAQIQTDESLRDIPVVVISALDETDSVVRCLQSGAEDYLTKPFNRVLLRARLQSSLEKKAWRDRQRESVTTLVDAMRTVERGDFAVTLDDGGRDLYAHLFRGFNHMVEGLRDGARLLDVTRDLAGEMHLDLLLQRIMRATSEVLDAERSSLFIYDEKTHELWSRVAEGLGDKEIRISADRGIAGHVFMTGETENVDDPYSHPKFDIDVDRLTGYVTRCLLCMPITGKDGQRIGVTQVLNKRGGPFTYRDEQRLAAFSAQVAVSLENARLFDDVLNIKNYNESILRSTSNGLITLDTKRQVVTINEAAANLLHASPEDTVGRPVTHLFGEANTWVLAGIDKVETSGQPDVAFDVDLTLPDGDVVSTNLSTVPLIDTAEDPIGSMMIIEDMTKEKRMRTTMARYMSKEVADQLLSGGEAGLGGKDQSVTILFSDIRRFTAIAETLGPRDTVNFLNEYFGVMVDVVLRKKGILDKYIGDAMMALFGAPFATPHDADNAIQAADDMVRALQRINRDHARTGVPMINIGIGVGTGEVLAGSIGSPKRMEYTVIGDSVNVAARLEQANKYYGTKVLLCESTAAKLGGSYPLREIDLLQLRNRDEPLAIYESLGYHTGETFPEMERVLESYGRGLACYRNRDWTAAITCFERALALNVGDSPSRIYLERCKAYAETPPPPDWDCVWHLTGG